jgi:hypothetical protein
VEMISIAMNLPFLWARRHHRLHYEPLTTFYTSYTTQAG